MKKYYDFMDVENEELTFMIIEGGSTVYCECDDEYEYRRLVK